VPTKKLVDKYVDDLPLYKERNGVELYFDWLNQYRRLTIRHDKVARNYLGFVWAASLRILLAQATQVQSQRPIAPIDQGRG
jgi:IS4 transposase